ncbi:hypothetical protein FJZ36_15035 [Candidatus Poribacteria bacterium]|nr:hypothetical protein [Candidatus Poribacteria bacterium]
MDIQRQAASSAAAREGSHAFVTPRTLVLGAALVVLNCFWQTPLSSTLDIEITDLALFANVVTILFALVLANDGFRALAPRYALQQRELLTLYAMLVTSTALNGTDMIKCLISLCANGTWDATPENDWANLFTRHFPPALTVGDKTVLRGYYEGDSSLYTPGYIAVWAPRALGWSVYVVLLIFTMLCVNSLIRRQWMVHERLTYPIAQLPCEVTRTDEPIPLLRNPLLWAGFGVAALVSAINQVHVWIPTVPRVPVQPFNLDRFFTGKPWNAVEYLYSTLYPFAVGMGYLMPLDLIVSTWVFHLVWQLERVFGSAMGFRGLPQFPYWGAQVSGGWMALLLVSIWTGRRYFRRVLGEAIRARRMPEDDEEPMSYRFALYGSLVGVLGLTAFGRYLGMSFWVLIPFFLLYLAMSTAITRIRAELGPPACTLPDATPDSILIKLLGTRRLGNSNVIGFGLLSWTLSYSMRENPMPGQLEAYRFADRAGLHPRGLPVAILLAAALGSVAGFWAYLHDAYELGIDSYPERSWAASTALNLLENRLQSPTEWKPPEAVFMAAGFLLTLALSAVRVRYLWWPLHPVGYVISGGWEVGRMFFPLILASGAKWFALRFTGVTGYRRSIPFFFGLILGDFVVGCLWATLGVVLHVPVYVFWTG